MMRPGLVGQAAAVVIAMTGGAAFAETKISADLGLNGGIATNPYGATVSDTSSATLNGTFAPTITLATPTGSFGLRGLVSHTEYAQRYSGTTDYSVSGTTSQQLSTLIGMNAAVTYSSTVRNALYPVIDPVTGLPTDPNAPIPVDPSAAVSYAERTRSVSGNLSFSATLSPRDTLSVSGRASRIMFPSTSVLARDYDVYGGGFSYMRAIGPASSIGLAFDVGRTEYGAAGLGTSTQYSPSVVYSTRLASRISLNANVGLTFSKTDLLVGSRNETSFSGAVGVCHKGERANFCMDASRRVAPSSLSGTSTVTSVGANYSYRLTGRSTISARASYARARSLSGIGNLNNDYLTGSITYSRQILQRLSAVISASYSDTYDSIAPRNANFYGSVGLSYRLGDF